MNLTNISNIPGSNLQRVKGRYVAAVAGVAMAISVIVAFGSSTATTEPLARRETPPLAVGDRGSVAPRHVFIIAASLAQQAEMEAANSDIRGSNPDRNDITVLLAGSPASQALLGEGSRELMAVGAPFSIVDMTASSALEAEPQPVAADSAHVDAERAAYTTLLEQIMLDGLGSASHTDPATTVLS